MNSATVVATKPFNRNTIDAASFVSGNAQLEVGACQKTKTDCLASAKELGFNIRKAFACIKNNGECPFE